MKSIKWRCSPNTINLWVAPLEPLFWPQLYTHSFYGHLRLAVLLTVCLVGPTGWFCSVDRRYSGCLKRAGKWGKRENEEWKLVGSPSWLRFDCFVSFSGAKWLSRTVLLSSVELSDCQTAKVPKLYVLYFLECVHYVGN